MCPSNLLLWPAIYNFGWSCTLKHCAILENIHTPPTAGIWMGNSWIYTSYISVVTIQAVIILMRLHKQKQCMMVHFQCRFHASDFKQIVCEFLFYTKGKIAKNLFGVGTWHPTVISSFRCTTTDCLQYISQNFWQTVPKFVWNSWSSLQTW